jgi:hypothetical protein
MSTSGLTKLRCGGEASPHIISATSCALGKLAEHSPYALFELLLKITSKNHQFYSENSETKLKEAFLVKPTGEIDRHISLVAFNSLILIYSPVGTAEFLRLVNPIDGALLKQFRLDDLEK